MEPELTKSHLDSIKDKFKYFKLSDIFNATTKENQYLCYLIDQYSKHIVGPYMSLFVGREGGLNVILDERFSDAKEQADGMMNDIGEFVNEMDIKNLKADDLTELAQKMDNGAAYMNHLKEALKYT